MGPTFTLRGKSVKTDSTWTTQDLTGSKPKIASQGTREHSCRARGENSRDLPSREIAHEGGFILTSPPTFFVRSGVNKGRKRLIDEGFLAQLGPGEITYTHPPLS